MNLIQQMIVTVLNLETAKAENNKTSPPDLADSLNEDP
jgi:hypothetical protein